MIGGYLGRGLGGEDLAAGDAVCKGCQRRVLVRDLSASGLCDNCLSAAFAASGARMAGSGSWGPADCAGCEVARWPAAGSGPKS